MNKLTLLFLLCIWNTGFNVPDPEERRQSGTEHLQPAQEGMDWFNPLFISSN